MNRFILAFILVVCNPNQILAQQPLGPDRDKGWQADIDSLLVLMKQQHFVYKSKPLPAELLKKSTQLKKHVAAYSEERMVFELERLMYYMHDGHSYVLPFATKIGETYYLPVQFYLFKDGVYLINADEPYTKLIGYRVMKINEINVEKIIGDMNSYVHQDNRFTVKWFAPTVMRFRGIYEMYRLKALSKNISVKLLDNSGKPVIKMIDFVPATNFRGIPKLLPSKLENAPPKPLYLSNVSTNFWLEKFPESRTLYFQFNQVYDMDNESLRQFSKKLDSTLLSFKPRLFIIDVRHNNGGNSYLLSPLLDAIKKFESDNKSAKIVVITGRNTFSAAQIFISLLNKDTRALFAGEPSSSSPNFVGEEGNTFILPFSGAMGNISNRYHESIPGDMRKWIQPNFSIPLSSKDYFKNQDPVMKFILYKFGK
jgi:hypothetical protein